ncbi:hypothetical protein F5890DRAFT_1557053 [Lentinula detonsa]|uniref:Uncharacterized protein n=1 Tax=Lentinula detonsa TaxID=2804962 RepID=A0AA38PT47_9AGAR|nr:hypothetical protein F5890DRAFT_1557053 [Lentinula detonsa]
MVFRILLLLFIVISNSFTYSAVTGDVCAVIASSISDASQVFRPGSSQYALGESPNPSNRKTLIRNLILYYLDLEHFALSAEQNSSCSVEPGSAQDVSTIVIADFGEHPYQIKSGGHNLNPKFSSTPGVQISMARFNQLQRSKSALG